MSATNEDGDPSTRKWLCYKCVGEQFLREEIRAEGTSAKCEYCNKCLSAYSIVDLADRIESVFEEHFVRTSDQPNGWQLSMMKDKELDYDWERDGEPVVYAIMNAADISEQAASDILEILEDRFGDFDYAKMGDETEFSTESHYEEKDANDALWQHEWETFKTSLKTEARLFNRLAEEHLKSVFAGLDILKSRKGKSLIVEAGPGTAFAQLYRARVFQNEKVLKSALERPDRELGPPPSKLAKAGRMNAQGISVFYAANDSGTALSEVRPPVGSSVVVAGFDILRPLKLLDLVALSDTTTHGSIFDEAFGARLERAMFLRRLSCELTRPVMPDDESSEYLPTQAIADFLATGTDIHLDGIIFQSAQSDGEALNVVLFHKASRVQSIELPPGTEVEVFDSNDPDDESDPDYTVFEEVPESPEQPRLGVPFAKSEWNHMDSNQFPHFRDFDDREETLRVATDSINVHLVKAVVFKTKARNVNRHRSTKQPTVKMPQIEPLNDPF